MAIPFKQSAERSLLLLITDGFDDRVVTTLIAECREGGVVVALVAASKQPVPSNHGIRFQPDMALHETNLIPDQPVLLVVNSHCLTTACATDPRIGRFLRHIVQRDGTVCATPEAALALNRFATMAGIDQDHFVIWWGHDIAQLTDQR